MVKFRWILTAYYGEMIIMTDDSNWTYMDGTYKVGRYGKECMG